ncbi:MAG: hypothetical protein KatS3mg114_0602 [Planctomycetaceae bacterium]|nr:MAG: hypothetical protein KatS3mg114_0602 [Planctomycetaceae bacterium]
MKGLLALMLSMVLGSWQMPPAPMPEAEGQPVPYEHAQVLHEDAPVELFQCVKYRRECQAHPCAVPLIIAVPDPCADKCACERGCVYVKICVPPCDCPRIRCTRQGTRVVYDFGKYEVVVVSRKGEVVVTYRD